MDDGKAMEVGQVTEGPGPLVLRTEGGGRQGSTTERALPAEIGAAR